MHSRMLAVRSPRSFAHSLLLAVVLCGVIVVSSCFSPPLAFSSPPGAITSRERLTEAASRELVTASLLTVKGDYWGAVDRYRKIMKVEPSNAALHYALSKAFLGLGILDSARRYSEKSVLLNPRNHYYLRYLAALSHQMSDYLRAAELYRQLATLEPGTPEPLSSLALEYLSSNQPEKALEVFQEILLIDPMNETTQAQVLLLEIQLRHYPQAIGILKEFIEQGSGKEKLRLTLGELYLQTKQYDMAFTTFRGVLRENPRFLPAWLSLFEVSVQSRNRKAFAEDLDRFYQLTEITLKEKTELATLFLVRSSRDSTYTEPALSMIAEINKRYPKSSAVYKLSGMAKLQKQDAKGAVVDFRRALLLEPQNINIWEELVTAYLAGKEFQLARTTVSKVKQRFPEMTQRVMVLEGEVLFRSGEFQGAARVLEGAMRLKNAAQERLLYLQAATTLALCYDKLGFAEKSVHLYEVILTLEPDNLLMMNNLAYVLAGLGKELPRARELARKAVAGEPANAGYLDTLGWVLFRMGEYQKAKEALEKAALMDPAEPEIADHLAQVYTKLGNVEKAMEIKARSPALKVKP